MQQEYSVELEDPREEFHVVSDGRDMRAWEAANDASYFRTESSLTKFAQVAHLAAVRHGLFAGTWEEFNARCVGSKPISADPPKEPADTTQKDPTAVSSARSRSAQGSRRPSSSKRETK